MLAPLLNFIVKIPPKDKIGGFKVKIDPHDNAGLRLPSACRHAGVRHGLGRNLQHQQVLGNDVREFHWVGCDTCRLEPRLSRYIHPEAIEFLQIGLHCSGFAGQIENQVAAQCWIYR